MNSHQNVGKSLKPARNYGRFSSKPQERGDSYRQQVEGAKEFAAKNGYEIIAKPYFDEAVSGKAGANLEKEFGRLLKDAKEGETILVQFSDRIGRQSPFLLGSLVYQATQRGISIHIWGEGKLITPQNIDDLGTQIGVFTGFAVGHQENNRKMQRVRDVTKQAISEAEEKGIQSGTLVKFLPQVFEWNATDKKIEINEEKADVIRDIFDMFNSGMGKTTIAQTLNSKGIPTLYKAGKKTIGGKKSWLETSIKKILLNESYAGVLNVKGHRLTCIPRVVKQSVFDKAQILLRRFPKRHGNHSMGRVNTLFSGIAICKYCNGSINVNISPAKKEGGKVSYCYRCKNAKLKTCDAKKFLSADMVELAFFDKFFGGTPTTALIGENKETQEKLEILNAKLTKVKQAIENLYDMAEGGDSTAKDRIAKRRIELGAIESEIKVLKSTMSEDVALPSAIQAIDDLMGSPEGKQAILDYFPKMKAALADNEIRKKLLLMLPTVFSKVVFDVINKELEVFNKQGQSLGRIDITGIKEAMKEIAEWQKETEAKQAKLKKVV